MPIEGQAAFMAVEIMNILVILVVQLFEHLSKEATA
jgi:hypothetical protein